MHVQVIHENAAGAQTALGLFELDHMPPVGEPFLVDSRTYYITKGFLGPDEHGLYLLILEGEAKLAE